MEQVFAIDDFVWAKMKTYPPWPARICEPPEGTTPNSKELHHFVYFFGTHDVAWIKNDMMIHHYDPMFLYAKKKINQLNSRTLQAAVNELFDELQKAPQKPSTEKARKRRLASSPESDITPGTSKKGKKVTVSDKNPENHNTASTSKIPKKVALKKKVEKKIPKKATLKKKVEKNIPKKAALKKKVVKKTPKKSALKKKVEKKTPKKAAPKKKIE